MISEPSFLERYPQAERLKVNHEAEKTLTSVADPKTAEMAKERGIRDKRGDED